MAQEGAYGALEEVAHAVGWLACALTVPSERIRAMKRMLLVLALAVALLGVLAAPAWAYVNPQPNTAYITSFVEPGQWCEWAGPLDPFNVIVHPIDENDPLALIPHGWNVVVTREWFDTRLGATLIPLEYFNTLAISRSTGGWRFAITKAACGVRYWSRAYRTGDPGLPSWVWARDWWVPLGKLPPGDYSGTVTQFAPHAIPSWVDWGDDTADPPIPPHTLPLLHPIWLQPVSDDLNWTQRISFTVGD